MHISDKQKRMACALAAAASSSLISLFATEPIDSIAEDLDEVTVVSKSASTRKLRYAAGNTDYLSSSELVRAACCNLGESFTTNPSVDVSYNDAVTGARQIKLLGLSGRYVQMLTENIPNFRGAAAPYGLSYVPGPWMESIQVSKGASSVKNGYESVTGQINVEMLKPTADPSVAVNAYADHMGRVEGNAAGNIHISPKLSTGLLLHGENNFKNHDENGDGFMDSPQIRQVSAMNRWRLDAGNYESQVGVRYLNEERTSGQMTHDGHAAANPYVMTMRTNRWEAFTKNAYIFDPANAGNVALILSGSWHDQKSTYGLKRYDVTQKNLYASLMFERKWCDLHSLSVGASLNLDDYDQLLSQGTADENETVTGGYAQYSFNMNGYLLLMAGVRYDYSSVYGSMFTPRVHARWNPSDIFSFHASAGKGYHSSHPWAEYSYMFASSRRFTVDSNLKQEQAYNMGAGMTADFYVADRKMSASAEYYFTTFQNQTVLDLDTDAHAARVMNAVGHSYSHAMQVELTAEPFDDFTATLAYRFTDARENYGYGYLTRPLTSRSKGLLTLSYTPMMGIWQFDVTMAVNGGGRLPTPDAANPLWNSTFKAYPQLSAQVTRNFRHFAIYVGGENLTGYRQKSPIVDAANPWGNNFDATMVYAPIHGALAYVGIRFNFTKY